MSRFGRSCSGTRSRYSIEQSRSTRTVVIRTEYRDLRYGDPVVPIVRYITFYISVKCLNCANIRGL